MLCKSVNRIPLPGIAQLLGLFNCLWRGVAGVGSMQQLWGEGDRTPLGCLSCEGKEMLPWSPKTSRMAPSADLQKQEALLLPVVGSCPMFQMCLRPCKAVPGSWEQTRTQLSAPQALQSDVLSRRLRIISTSLIHTAESMSDLFCQLSWSMQSWRTGNMDTTLQL